MNRIYQTLELLCINGAVRLLGFANVLLMKRLGVVDEKAPPAAHRSPWHDPQDHG